MKTAIILGQGGHAKVIHSFIKEKYENIKLIGPEEEEKIFNQKTYLEGADFYIGIGDNINRKKVFKKVEALNLSLPVCIGPNSFIADSARIGKGSFIGAGCIVMAGTNIGKNVIVNTMSSVDHDCVIESHSQLTAGITLGGATIIGMDCFLGIKVATIPGVKIGNNVQVMAGSLVTKNVQDNVLIGGYPSKMIKNLEQE